MDANMNWKQTQLSGFYNLITVLEMNPISYFIEFNKKGANYEQKGRIILRERDGKFKKNDESYGTNASIIFPI